MTPEYFQKETAQVVAQNQILQGQLATLVNARNKIYQDLHECRKLRKHLLLSKSNQNMQTLLNIGVHTFVDCEIPDTSSVFVNIGAGYHLKMSIDEAIAYLDQREKRGNRQALDLARPIAELRIDIQDLVLKLQSLNN